MILALMKLGFRLDDVMSMSVEEALGWVRAAMPKSKNKKFIVRKQT